MNIAEEIKNSANLSSIASCYSQGQILQEIESFFKRDDQTDIIQENLIEKFFQLLDNTNKTRLLENNDVVFYPRFTEAAFQLIKDQCSLLRIAPPFLNSRTLNLRQIYRFLSKSCFTDSQALIYTENFLDNKIRIENRLILGGSIIQGRSKDFVKNFTEDKIKEIFYISLINNPHICEETKTEINRLFNIRLSENIDNFIRIWLDNLYQGNRPDLR